MLTNVGVDPYDWPLGTFGDAFLSWAKERVVGASKDGEQKWALFERDLWAETEPSDDEQRRIAEQNKAAKAELLGG